MLNLTDTENNTKYSFIPKSKWIDNITKGENFFCNDVYKKYNANLNVEGELIVCTDLKKQDSFCKKISQETYQEYLEFIVKRDIKKEQWVYNILDGIAEQDRILYRDEHIVIIPNYTWDGKDTQKMHILTFPTNKTLRSIRNLDARHIDLLLHCKNKTLEIIKNAYGYDKEIIKMFIHYSPSTYHLHIHFVLVSNIDCNSSVEYSHELSNVIFNLSIRSDYYKMINMNKRNF
jgi:diadenosine tetraphosphate (Ap4A) HIT family hydrolase